MKHRHTLAVVFIAAVLLGCEMPAAQARPEIIIPPGVASLQTPEGVAAKMLAEIDANEQRLGRALAPARIIRIQLLRPGELYEGKRLDGSNPHGLGFSPSDGPGWMVEAVGTFVGKERGSGRIASRGFHGFHLWDDAGGEAYGFHPCWSVHPMHPDDREGDCP